MWSIRVPTIVPISKNKRFSLNLNQYRNAHHHTLDKAKKEFDAIVKPSLGVLPRMDGVNLTFTLFTGTLQRIDTSNVCAIVDKFFCDSLVTSGRIPDDNCTVVLSVDYRYGGYAKGDPHVVVTVEPVGTIYIDPEKEEEDMQITIVQAEIELAIKNYIMSQITVNENQDINIQLKATRGDEGYQAIIDIKPAAPAPTGPAPKGGTKAKETPPAKSLNISKTVEAAKSGKDTTAELPAESKDDAADAGNTAGDTADADADDATQGEALDPTFQDDTNVVSIAKEEPASATTEAPKSIFAGLKKPVNS